MIEYIDKVTEWLLQMGLSESISLLLLRVGVILVMLRFGLTGGRVCSAAYRSARLCDCGFPDEILPHIHYRHVHQTGMFDNIICICDVQRA